MNSMAPRDATETAMTKVILATIVMTAPVSTMREVVSVAEIRVQRRVLLVQGMTVN